MINGKFYYPSVLSFTLIYSSSTYHLFRVGFPEEFLACEESSIAKERIISAGEDLFINMLEVFPDQIATFMMTLLQSSDLAPSSSSTVFAQREKVLFYDAVFNCTGLASLFLIIYVYFIL